MRIDRIKPGLLMRMRPDYFRGGGSWHELDGVVIVLDVKPFNDSKDAICVRCKWIGRPCEIPQFEERWWHVNEKDERWEVYDVTR